MRLVIPISKADVHLLPAFQSVLQYTKWPNFKGGRLPQSRTVVISIVASDSVREQAVKFYHWLKKEFRDVGSYIHLVDDFPGGWPAACNSFFMATLDYLKAIENNRPWMFLELDQTPIRRDWLLILQKRYEACRAPFLGLVQPSWVRDLQEEKYKRVGSHVTGSCCVYPRDYYNYEISPFPLKDWNNLPYPPPWDMVQSGCIFSHGVEETGLFQNNSRTYDYQRHAGQVIPMTKSADVADFPLDFQQPVDPKAVMVHGCKDGSLAKLVAESEGNLFSPALPTTILRD